MSKGDEQAFPVANVHTGREGDIETFVESGMTKREYFAAMVLQGLASNVAGRTPAHEWPSLVPEAVLMADALLAALAKDAP